MNNKLWKSNNIMTEDKKIAYTSKLTNNDQYEPIKVNKKVIIIIKGIYKY